MSVGGITFKFVSEGTLDSLSKTKKATHIQEISLVKQMPTLKNDNAYTHSLMYCLGGVVKKKPSSEKEKFYHFFPAEYFANPIQGLRRRIHSWNEGWKPGTVKKKWVDKWIPKPKNPSADKKFKAYGFDRALRKMSKEDSSGFLIGGLYAKDYKYADWSLQLFNRFKRGINPESKKNFTVFYGQKTEPMERTLLQPRSDFFYDKENKVCYVSSRRYDAFGHRYSVLDPKELKDSFAHIHIAKGDSVEVDGEVIPNSFWNSK